MSENEKKETQVQESKPKKTMKLPLIIGVVVIVLAADIFGYNYSKHLKQYNEAVTLYNAGDFVNAATNFKSLGSFKDSEDYLNKSNYSEAKVLMDAAQYTEALAIFEELGDYEDSQDFVALCNKAIAYEEATTLYENKDFEAAQKAFEALEDYNDSAVLAENCGLTIKAQSLDGTKWFYSESNNNINILTFTKDSATITKHSFDGNGIHQTDVSDCDYVATKDALILTDKNTGAETSVDYKLDGDKVILDKNTYATSKMIDKKIQGYWVAEDLQYTTLLGRSYFSKSRYDLILNDGKAKGIRANTANPRTNYDYFYFGPDTGTYKIGNGVLEFTIDGSGKGGLHQAETFFTYLNGKVTLYHYTLPYSKSSRKSLPDNSFYSSYF